MARRVTPVTVHNVTLLRHKETLPNSTKLSVTNVTHPIRGRSGYAFVMAEIGNSFWKNPKTVPNPGSALPPELENGQRDPC